MWPETKIKWPVITAGRSVAEDFVGGGSSSFNSATRASAREEFLLTVLLAPVVSQPLRNDAATTDTNRNDLRVSFSGADCFEEHQEKFWGRCMDRVFLR
jgi:hypothetical protein